MMKDDERINFKQLKITRRIGYGNKIKNAEIHVFPSEARIPRKPRKEPEHTIGSRK
jgi:hypothetical protein